VRGGRAGGRCWPAPAGRVCRVVFGVRVWVRGGRVVFGVRVWVRGGRAGLPAIGRADRWALGGRGVGRGLLGRWLRGC